MDQRMPGAWRRVADRGAALSPGQQDAALAALCGVFDLLGFSEVVTASTTGFPALLVGYAAAGYLVLAWRRRVPRTVFALMAVHATIAVLAIPGYRPVIGLMVALYTVAALDSRDRGLPALALAAVPIGFEVHSAIAGAPTRRVLAALLASAILLTLINVGAWGLGRWAHSHRRQVVVLEQQRAEAALGEALAGGRHRLACDLRDTVAQQMGAMLVQAASARRVLATDPERTAEALATIEGIGSQATAELRRLRTVLRAVEPNGLLRTDETE